MAFIKGKTRFDRNIERLINPAELDKVTEFLVREWKEEDKLRIAGSIYLMKCENYIKIGRAFNPIARHYSLKYQTPFEVELLFHQKVRDDKELEAYLHFVFRDKHYKGEWFSLDEEDVNKVKEICEKNRP